MATWFSPKVEKRQSAIEGRGLFAIAAIPAGDVVVVKGGHVFDRNTRDAIMDIVGPAEIQVEDDLFIGPLTIEERERTMMHLNHSCEPNVGISGQIIFRAMQDIAAGDALTFDYATGDDDDWDMVCHCGATQCRKIVSGRDWRLPEVQRRYHGWFSEYLARKISADGGARSD